MAQYKRVLLKLSGESLMGKKQYGIDETRLAEYAEQIKAVVAMGTQVGIVIGGGNIFRGLSGASKGFDRVKGDQMGMLATVINSLALSSALTAIGVRARVLTAIRMEPIGEYYNKWRAIELLEQGEVVIMSGGTGNPFFTTDTGSSLRAIEIEADVMLKGTRVDGIYTADPEKDPTAMKFQDITYDEIYNRGLKVMDLTATTMCKENNDRRFRYGYERQPREGDEWRADRNGGAQLIRFIPPRLAKASTGCQNDNRGSRWALRRSGWAFASRGRLSGAACWLSRAAKRSPTCQNGNRDLRKLLRRSV